MVTWDAREAHADLCSGMFSQHNTLHWRTTCRWGTIMRSAAGPHFAHIGNTSYEITLATNRQLLQAQ
eukprot:scaffold325997_cov22-Prasinocladus_malaysianus.AAC.1